MSMLEGRNGRKEPGPFLSPLHSTTSSLSWLVQLSLIFLFLFRRRIDFTMPAASSRLISVHPDELKFQFELGKQSYCDLKVWNNTEHHVAFKVKTTSPKKYFVQPNTGVIHPWDSSVIRVTPQSQRENTRDVQCKDKFLLQSTIVPPNTEVDGLQQDTFNKDSGKAVEECKLRVVYVSPQTAEEALKEFKQNTDSTSDLQRLKNEKDKIMQQTQQLQQELETLKRRRNRKGDSGFSQTFAVFVGLMGIMVGILLNLSLSSPSTE